jgi:UDPglucose--hexose-1-phosphate uridylyltransferase
LDEYCIIAAERKKRPSDFRKGKQEREEPKDCPFCPGNEEMTPPAEAVYTDDGVLTDGAKRVQNWKARAFPNLFAAMVPSPEPPIAEWMALSGRGYHEVVVDCPDHGSSPANFGKDQMKLMLQVYTDRYSHYRGMGGVNYVSIFKNWGEAAGASLSHTHSQIIAIPITPPSIKRELSALSAASFCLYCNIVEREMASNRLIAKNDNWILIAPFCSQSPYETWIIPREHIGNLKEMSENQHKDLASILHNGLSRLMSLMDDPPYNYMIFQLPSNYHLNIRIQPALTTIAGFERSTGIYINSVPPEQAASELRME